MTVKKIVLGIWIILVTSSVVALCFYRSKEGHGPDMIALEMTAFLAPCVVALGVSFVLLFIDPQDLAWRYPIGTFFLGLMEVVVYSTFVMR